MRMESPLHKIVIELTHINNTLLKKFPGKDVLPDTKVEIVKFYKHWNDVEDIAYNIRQFPLMEKEILVVDAKELLVQSSIFIELSRKEKEDWEESIHFESFSEKVVPTQEEYQRIIGKPGLQSELLKSIIDGIEGIDKKAEWQTLCKVADNISQFQLIYLEMLASQLRDLAVGTLVSLPKYPAL